VKQACTVQDIFEVFLRRVSLLAKESRSCEGERMPFCSCWKCENVL